MLRVATIGAGYFAQFHHQAWAAEPRADLVAVCDADAGKARQMARAHGVGGVYSDPAKMLHEQKPDLVDIITPPQTHLEFVSLCAERGINAICQKAFCRNLAEAQSAAQVAERAGIKLIVHENFRFSPWYRKAHALIAQGALGTLYQVTFRLRPGDGQGPSAYLDRQPYFQTMERFLVHETAIHFIDVFRFLLGEPASVYADLRRLNPAIAGEDAGLMVFDFGDGVRAVFDGNRLSDHAAQNRRLTMGEFLAEGSAGTLRLDGDGTLTVRRFGENQEEAVNYPFSAKVFAGGAVAALQGHVIAHILDGAPAENTARDYLRNLEIEDAVYRSAAEGRRQALSLHMR